MSSLYQIPTFANGFARNASQSLFPNLWNGLVGLWAPFLGVQGNILFDFSGFRNNGSLINMTNDDWVPGNLGWALNFSGAQYIDVGDISLGESYPFAAMGWVNTTFSSDHQIIFSEGNSTSNTPLWNIGVDPNGKGWGFLRNNANQSTIGGLVGTTNINDGKWHHVAVVFTSTIAILYVDGIQEDSVATPSLPITLDITNIGRTGRLSPNDYVTGQIGEVAIYNRALSATEIAQLYHNQAAMLQLAAIDLTAFFVPIVSPFLAMDVNMSAKKADVGLVVESAEIDFALKKADITFTKVIQ